jgi:transposase-like protein
MDERMQFVARRLAGEQMAELCREFGISRKTGYKIFDRYQEMRDRRTDGQEPTSVSVRESAPLPGGELHLKHEA